MICRNDIIMCPCVLKKRVVNVIVNIKGKKETILEYRF